MNAWLYPLSKENKVYDKQISFCSWFIFLCIYNIFYHWVMSLIIKADCRSIVNQNTPGAGWYLWYLKAKISCFHVGKEKLQPLNYMTCSVQASLWKKALFKRFFFFKSMKQKMSLEIFFATLKKSNREAQMSRVVFTFKRDIFIDQKIILHLKALNKT